MKDSELRGARARWVTIVIVLLTVVVSWSGYVDKKTEAYVDNATVQALGAFATARLLNGVLTMAASTEVEGSVVFGALSIRPLEWLDPLHDVAERYSVVMELSIVSLVIQKLLIGITSASSFKLLLTLLGGLLVASLFIQEGRYSSWLLRLFAFVALVRFLFVFALAATALLDQAYVNRETERNIASVKATADDLEHLEVAMELHRDEREALVSHLDELRDRSDALSADVDAAKSALDYAADEVKEAEAEVASIEDGLSFIERNNPLTDDQTLLDARSKLRERKDSLAGLKKELQAAETALENATEEAEEITAALEGRGSTSWFDGFASKTKSMLDITRFDGLGERVKNIIPNILNLIALFLLKTLFIPLVFLVLLLRGFRYIWGVDLRDFGRSVTGEVRKELRMAGAKEGGS